MMGVKWMMILTEEQAAWIKETAQSTHLKGSDVGREAIAWCMKEREFKNTLASAQYKIELATLEQKKLEIEEKEQELKRKMKQERVAA